MGRRFRATRFAALTGVSRERLRTWERRYGFPEPQRTDAGPRRYALEDVQRVVAVRRAAEAGVPIPRAIERTRYDEAPAAPRRRTSSPRSSSTRRCRSRRCRAPRRCVSSSSTARCAPCRARRAPARS